MTEYAIIYDTVTGAQIGNYMGASGTSAAQVLPSGASYMLVPFEAWTTPADLAIIKKGLCTQIEAQADDVAAKILTLSPRHVLTAVALKEESDTWTSSSTAPFPFLEALATANDTTIAEENTAFEAAWAAAVPPGALINATSIAAQRRVMAATTLVGMATAAAIDWVTVMATLA